MSYALIIIVGLSVGMLWTSTQIPKFRLLPMIAATVVLLACIYFINLIPALNSNQSTLFGISGIAGALLAPGILWKGHPLLVGLGFFERLKYSSRNTQMLRESLDDRTPQD